jgi:hypothetical protein
MSFDTDWETFVHEWSGERNRDILVRQFCAWINSPSIVTQAIVQDFFKCEKPGTHDIDDHQYCFNEARCASRLGIKVEPLDDLRPWAERAKEIQ